MDKITAKYEVEWNTTTPTTTISRLDDVLEGALHVAEMWVNREGEGVVKLVITKEKIEVHAGVGIVAVLKKVEEPKV